MTNQINQEPLKQKFIFYMKTWIGAVITIPADLVVLKSQSDTAQGSVCFVGYTFDEFRQDTVRASVDTVWLTEGLNNPIHVFDSQDKPAHILNIDPQSKSLLILKILS